MIEIMKASAGSGKTYTLAHKYIDLLMANDDEFAYRHILAVTFTNKATDEMKGRILAYLYEISRSDGPDAAKAGRILSNILHDYSAFSISTIDKFFQQTLRSFARELGHFASYQVELDSDSLVEEAVDNILDSLDESDSQDVELMDFILDSMERKAADGKKPDVSDELKGMGKALMSEDFAIKSAALGLNAAERYTPAHLKELSDRCHSVRAIILSGLRAYADRVLAAMESAGVSPEDFSGGSRSFALIFRKVSASGRSFDYKPLTDSFIAKASDSSKWFPKAKEGLRPAAEAALGTMMEDFVPYYQEHRRDFLTAGQIISKLYGMAVAVRLSREFQNIKRDRNVVCLSESNTLLKQIIDGSDAPFVYEKIGVRLEHFLLDEFQDTSVSQWDNFLPLLRESESRGGRNLIVGDVKQSIYRWRESDWSLLDSRIQKEFPTAKSNTLANNFRSLEGIINFNNDFYPVAAARLDSICPEGYRKISGIYSDVKQHLGREENAGTGAVDVRFPDDREAQLDVIADSISTLVSTGARYGDIAVLVRRNVDGTDVANKLISCDIPVVTEASLRIKNSTSVRRLVSLMCYVDNPSDTVNAYFASGLKVDRMPRSYHSIAGLCESLYMHLLSQEEYAEECRADTMYVTAFMDIVKEYGDSRGNNLREFLRYWEEKDPTISSPLDSDAVRILTIHKSKGLDFPYVFLPFTEKLELYNDNTVRWCSPDVEGTALDGMQNELFNLRLTSVTGDTAFAADYLDEVYNQVVDNMNMMYVATTRASHGMMILGSSEGKNIKNFADILYEYCGCQDKIFGTEYDFSKLRREESAEKQYPIDYKVFPLDGRLVVRPYASDFFTHGEGFEGLSFRERGIVLHDILGHVRVAGDLHRAVDMAVEDGSLPSQSRDRVFGFLDRRINEHPEIFAEGGRVLCENTILASDGSRHQPDRVVITGDKVRIIDYKFGVMRPEYQDQIERYRELFLSMGYRDVKANLWFVYQNEMI